SPEIFRGQVEKIVERSREGAKPAAKRADILMRFSEEVRSAYQSKVGEERFLELIQKVTPYPYLSTLKMGSRPAKRGGLQSVQSLRAIPWILCWTQTRVLFP